nr:reverse transcriptase domain-containing protein [Tanacetum cinerariifolium]
MTLAGPSVPSPPSFSSKEVEQDPETITNQVKEKQENDKIKTKPDKNEKRGKVWQYINELKKCMALADLGASINLTPLFIWKKLMLPELVPTRMTLELANRSVAYPVGIAEDVFVQVGRPFLRTARALVDVYGKELILRGGDEKFIFHADSTFKHPYKNGNESINMINFIGITCEDRLNEVLTPFENSDSHLEEFADELALLDPFLPRNEDDNFDPEAGIRELEYLLYHDPSTDSSPTTDIDIINPVLERFTDEHALIYSFPPRDDDDDLLTLSLIMTNEKSFCMVTLLMTLTLKRIKTRTQKQNL